MITHEEARDVLVREKMVWNTSEFAEAYISQQEKVTELLELYRHLYFHDKMMSEEEFYQTLYKIKTLEGEMK